MKRYRPLFSETHPYYIEKYVYNTSQHLNRKLEEGSWYPSFIPIKEAVIRPDKYVVLIIKELTSFLQEYDGKTFRYPLFVVDLLNKKFSKYNFTFIEVNSGDINYLSGIDEASTLPKNFKTTFQCNIAIGDLFTNKKLQEKFIEVFQELLGHELIHRGQFLNKQDEEIRKEVFKAKKVYDMTKENDVRSYLSSKQEIMSYAWMIIEELRFNGLSNNQILTMIRRDSDIKNLSPILDEYKRLFDNDSGVLTCLRKEILFLQVGDEFSEKVCVL